MSADSLVSSIFGTVGSVITAALPILSRVLEEGDPAGVRIGSAVVHRQNGEYWISNTPFPGETDDKPIFVCFQDEFDEGVLNETTMLAVNDWMKIDDALTNYASGQCAISGDGNSPERGGNNMIMKMVTWASRSYLSAGGTTNVPIVIGKDNTMQLTNTVINNNGVPLSVFLITVSVALGAVYVLGVKSISGNRGVKNGFLKPKRRDSDDTMYEYYAELPDGLDVSDGIYEFSIQFELPVEDTRISKSTNPDAVIMPVPAEIRDKLRVINARGAPCR